MIPGLFAYSSCLTIIHVGVSVFSERDEGIQRRVNSTPITSVELILSQLLSYAVLSFLQ